MVDKFILGSLATIIGMATYIPYYRDIFRRRTKPHMFSWFLWSFLQLAAFIAQISHGAGAGSWAMGATGFLCFTVFLISLKYGEKKIVPFDWFCFSLGILGLILWIVTSDALIMVVAALVVDLLGFLPTFRKAYARPYEETLVTYLGSTISFTISLFALDVISLVTSLNLIYLVLANGIFVLYLWIRRTQIKTTKANKS